ncbi:MAG: adenylosuccinate lyase [Candidatus Dormibacteria bacterium]
MIDRYAPKELRDLWSDRRRLELWLQVELAVCEARFEQGELSAAAMSVLRRLPPPSPQRVAELEEAQGHDLAAFVSALQEEAGPAGRHLHLGLTSQDVLDTALALQLREASRILLADAERVERELEELALRHRDTAMIGRTHGMHAEPLTFGFVVANHLDEVRRATARLRAAALEVEVGKISGAVGTHATVSAEVEVAALARLDLEPAPITTQVVARDRHAAYMCALALLGAVCERLAVNLRHLQRTEVNEAREPFGAQQKGSSAMPHKRNPVKLEQVCGLARLLRGWALAALEDVALWHERDISHSSVERVCLPDATMALGHMLRTLVQVLHGLEVDRARMTSNLDQGAGLAQSQRLLLALIGRGQSREEAYRLVQALAAQAQAGKVNLQDLAGASADVRSKLSAEEVDGCFELQPSLAGIGESYRRLGLATDRSPAPAEVTG